VIESVLFLDIDGVLNDHEFNWGASSNTLKKECVDQLNRILDNTNCVIVLSTAWRYMIHRGAMTLVGFSYLLRTHGVHLGSRIPRLVDLLPMDTGSTNPGERSELILEWLKAHGAGRPWAAVDDMALPNLGERFVRTDGAVGLTDDNTDALIGWLGTRL
jgi:hypothetical protein